MYDNYVLSTDENVDFHQVSEKFYLQTRLHSQSPKRVTFLCFATPGCNLNPEPGVLHADYSTEK